MSAPLPYLRWADPTRPALVFLHGFLGNASDWADLAPFFAADFDVIAVDLPGHGAAHDRPEAECAVDAAARAVVATLDEVGLGRFSVCGYSMGGRIALHLATHFSERMSRLVLVGASPGLRTEDEREARIQHDAALADRLAACASMDRTRRFLERWYAAPLWSATPEPLRAAWVDARQTGDPSGWARALRAGGTGQMAPLWDLLPALRVPTLALHGAADAKFAGIAREMADASASIQAHPIPDSLPRLGGAGHAAHAEQPAAFVDAALRFLTRPVPRSSDPQIPR